MKSETSKRKIQGLAIGLGCALLLALFLSLLSLHLYLKNTNLNLVRGEVIAPTFTDGREFLISLPSGDYTPGFASLDALNQEFHTDLEIGDSAYMICELSNEEIYPGSMRIQYIFKW